jgi:hypothetical protein
VSGKGNVFTVLILVIVAFAVAGCASPVMSIVEAPGSSGRLELVPKRAEYTVGDVFKLNGDHLQVFTFSGGAKKEVSLDGNDCEVWVIDPNGESIRVKAEGLMFYTSGKKNIRVWYKNFAPQEYPITVQPETQVEMGTVGFEWAPN